MAKLPMGYKSEFSQEQMKEIDEIVNAVLPGTTVYLLTGTDADSIVSFHNNDRSVTKRIDRPYTFQEFKDFITTMTQETNSEWNS